MSEHAEDREGMEYGAEAPTVEVLVYRDGGLIHRELCESAEAAAGVVEEWGELDGVTFSVDDLAVKHSPDQILEPEPEDTYAAEDDSRSTGSEYPD